MRALSWLMSSKVGRVQDWFPTSAVRQIINLVAGALSEAVLCETGGEVRLVSHFNFFIPLGNPRGEG